MNPLAAIIAAFAALKNDLHTRFNAVLAKLPPLDQIEGGNAVLGVIREVEWAGERMTRLGQEVEGTLAAAATKLADFQRKADEPLEVTASRLLEAMLAEAGATAIGAAIAAKTHLPVEDHQTALGNAREEGRKAAEVEFNAKVEALQTLAARREEVTIRLGAEASAAIPDTDLLAEGYQATVDAMAARIETLATAGITAASHPRNFASLLGCGLDESGTTQFTARLEMLKEAAVVPTAASAPAKPAAASPAPTLPAASPAKAEVVI